MVNLDVPSILSTEHQKGVDEDQLAVPFGNGWMVRESVGDALKRIKGETLGSVVLECKYLKLDDFFELHEIQEVEISRTINATAKTMRPIIRVNKIR